MSKAQDLIDDLGGQRGAIIIIPKTQEDRTMIQELASVYHLETIVDPTRGGTYGEIRVIVNDFGA